MTRRAIIWAVVAGCLGLLAVNGHLVYVALTSQPDCVKGEGGYAPARRSC